MCDALEKIGVTLRNFRTLELVSLGEEMRMKSAARRCMCIIGCVLMVVGVRAETPPVPAAAWRLVATRTFKDRRALYVAVTPNLDRVAVAPGHYSAESDFNHIALYDATGQELWTYQPEESSNVYVDGISVDGDTVVGFIYPQATESSPASPPPPRRFVFLDGNTGEVISQLPLDDTDAWRSFVSGDASMLIIRGNNPRLVKRDGTVLFRFKELERPWFTERDLRYGRFFIAPDNASVIVLPKPVRHLLQMTPQGEPVWELEFPSGFMPNLYLAAVAFDRNGYLLVGGNTSLEAVKFPIIPEAVAKNPFGPQHYTVARGWSLALFRVGSGDGLSLFDLAWSDGRLELNTGAGRGGAVGRGVVWDYRLLDADLVVLREGRREYITVVAASSERLHVYDLDQMGTWLENREIALQDQAVRGRVAVAGDPPVILLAYDTAPQDLPAGETCLLQMRLYDVQGTELFRWAVEDGIRDVWLSPDGGRALVQTSSALYFFARDRGR